MKKAYLVTYKVKSFYDLAIHTMDTVFQDRKLAEEYVRERNRNEFTKYKDDLLWEIEKANNIPSHAERVIRLQNELASLKEDTFEGNAYIREIDFV